MKKNLKLYPASQNSLNGLGWPVTGQFAGYIRARSLPHIGMWTDFSPAQIANFCNTIHRPSPIVSEPTKPDSPWIMPTPKKKGYNSYYFLVTYT